MRARNELERLAAAGRPLLAEADSLVDAVEEARILERILASPRSDLRSARRLRAVPALAAVGAVAAVIAVILASSSTKVVRHHDVALSGARIEVAGYDFRTPAGFKASSGSCGAPSSGSGPTSVVNGFAAAASADGGCIEASYLIADGALRGPTDAQPVDIGRYRGYYVSRDVNGQSSLFVDLPKAGGDQHNVSLLLLAKGLTEDQLIAVAESGLPGSP